MSRRNRKPTSIGPFVGGLDNVQKETSIPKDSLAEALNVDIRDDGKIQKRAGREAVYSGTDIHSLYSHGNLCVFMESGSLKRLNDDYSTTTLATGLNSSLEVAYETVNGKTYYTSEGGTGKLTWDGQWDRWGISAPKFQPTLLAGSGNLQAGEYQVAVTYVSYDGEESGTRDAAVITLEDNQKVVLSGIPVDMDSEYVKVYATQVNDTTLYHQMTLNAGTTTADLAYNENGEALENQFKDSPIEGHFIASYNGRIYVAYENLLFFTDPYEYDMMDFSSNFIVYPEKIRFLKALNNGLFIGSDIVYFLRGDDPTEMKQREAYHCYPIYDSAVVIETTLFNFENIFGQGVFFWSNQGAMIGTEEGFVIPLSSKKYIPDLYDKGKSFFRQEDGISSIISAVQNKGGSSTLGAEDAATATITRNGITIG